MDIFGRILPDRIPLRIEGPEWTSEALGIRYRIKITIVDGQFIAPVTVESGNQTCTRSEIWWSMDAIKAHADYPRHGKVSSISDHERGNVFRLTKEIVWRYLTYLCRSKTELPTSEFPSFVLPELKPT
jgi:hypothetical protein